MSRPTPWSLTFHDGSGNGFRFWLEAPGEARFEYTPVTPALSSSGFYSGGAPRAGELSDAEVEALWEQVERIEADPTLREQHRVMGSGSFKLTTPAGERRFLVQRDAARAFDQSLAAYRGPEPGTR